MGNKGCFGCGGLGAVLGIVGLAALFSTMGGSFILVMILGIISGGAEMRKYQEVQAEVVSIDRRCSDQSVPIAEMTRSCTEEELEERRQAFHAPRPAPVHEHNVITYPGRPQPGPGVAYVILKYKDASGGERTAEVRTWPIKENFYSWEPGSRTTISMCKRDPAIVRVSVLDHTTC